MARGLKYRKGVGKFRVKGRRAMRKNSGYLKSGPSFFPSHAPIWWSYTNAFGQGSTRNHGFVTVGEIVKKKLEGSTGTRMDEYRNSWKNSALLSEIETILNAAKKEEAAFIAKYKLDIDPNDWGSLIKGFTVLFTSEDAFKRNAQLLSQVKENKSSIYHNFTAYLSSYVQTAARDIIGKNKDSLIHQDLNSILPKLTDDIIELALKRMFKMTDLKLQNGYIETNSKNQEKLEGQEIQAFKFLLDKIKLFMNSPFKQLVIEELGLTKEFIEETLRIKINNSIKGNKRQRLPLLKSSIRNGNIRGSVQEHFEKVLGSLAGEELNLRIGNNVMWVDIETGYRGAKTDVLLHNLQTTAEGHIPDIEQLYSTAGDDNSKRINAMNNSEKFFNLLHQAEGEIIFISDKNYQIKSNFDGFSAQGDITLENLKALLNKVHYPGDIDKLYGYLSNCGSNMLLGTGKASEVLNGVATYIGHFLFDDLTITGDLGGVNRVHLLNLSGFYMPLSVYLGAVLNAARSAEEDVSNYASAHFYGHGEPPQAHGWSGSGDFDTFRQTRLDESRIEIKFMANIADFIMSRVKF